MPRVLTDKDFEDGKGGVTEEKGTSNDTFSADAQVIIDGDKETIVEPDETETPEEGAEIGKEPQPEPGDNEPEDPDKGKPKYKHKTWDETEKARIELEREHTKKSMRISELEKENAQLRKPAEPKPTKVEDEKQRIVDEGLDKINSLKVEYDSDGKPKPESLVKRDREAALIWGDVTARVAQVEIEKADRAKRESQDIVKKTYQRAQKEGLKRDAELRILGHEFQRTDPSLSVDERIEQAVESTKTILGEVRTGFTRRTEKDKVEIDDLKVLGRGSSRDKGSTITPKDTKPSTMANQLEELNKKRTMTKDDLR